MSKSLFDQTYVPLSLLGMGGMGEVFRARQTGDSGFQREVALKRINKQFSEHPRAARMFLEEARLAAAMNHPNVVHIYDVGRDQGKLFLAMERVDGTDLRGLAEQATRRGEMIPLRHALGILMQVLEGLRYAHNFQDEEGRHQGVVHGDIGPNNILISFDGVVKLLDFGLAAAEGLLREGGKTPIGKLAYMSPEAVRGEPLEPRSDVFGVGILLYELTVGKRLFRVNSFESMQRVLREPIAPPTFVRPGYPPGLEMVVMRALEVDADERYPTAEAMLEELEEFVFEAGVRVSRLQLGRYVVRAMGGEEHSGLQRLLEEEGEAREEEGGRDPLVVSQEELSFDAPKPSRGDGDRPRRPSRRPAATPRSRGCAPQSEALAALRAAEEAMAALAAAEGDEGEEDGAEEQDAPSPAEAPEERDDDGGSRGEGGAAAEAAFQAEAAAEEEGVVLLAPGNRRREREADRAPAEGLDSMLDADLDALLMTEEVEEEPPPRRGYWAGRQPVSRPGAGGEVEEAAEEEEPELPEESHDTVEDLALRDPARRGGSRGGGG